MYSRKEEWLVILISLLISVIPNILLYKYSGLEFNMIFVLWFVVICLCAITVCLIYSRFFRACDNCQKKGKFQQIVFVSNPNPRHPPLQVGFFCQTCYQEQSWRNNPKFSQFANLPIDRFPPVIIN